MPTLTIATCAVLPLLITPAKLVTVVAVPEVSVAVAVPLALFVM